MSAMAIKLEDRPVERRSKRRFVMEREIRYRVLDQDEIIAVGSGTTFNLSSSGVAFHADRELPAGAFIELSIAWPALLENRCPLQLRGFGRILRSTSGRTAASIEQYEFRTSAKTVAERFWVSNSDQRLRRWAEAVARV
jgi:hypothetical protein